MDKRSTDNTSGEKWTLNEIKNLVGFINKNKIREFELEQGDLKIHVITQYHEGEKAQASLNPAPQMIPVMPAQVMPHAAPASPVPVSYHTETQAPPPKPREQEKAPEKEKGQEKAEDEDLVEIKSPMVGTFYRAPSPESPPYVQISDKITKETVLCIVEAMKLMNEIKAEMNGSVVDILVENGQPVEYGQPMFKIKPA